MGKKIVILLIKIRNFLFGDSPNMESITNPHQAKEACRTAPPFYRRKIITKWNNFIFAEIEREQTLYQVRKSYLHSHPNSKAEEAAFKKGVLMVLNLVSKAPTVIRVKEIKEEGHIFLNKEAKENISKKIRELQKN